ncbi:MAG: hypothetical protein Ta2F_14850 [Termitinemataceae bacterium]|nr:MAG: hypothetical protein Ta2F_14850 [Termitinemataceae bacterium]
MDVNRHHLRVCFFLALLAFAGGALFSQEEPAADSNAAEQTEQIEQAEQQAEDSGDSTEEDPRPKIRIIDRFIFAFGMSIFILKEDYDFQSAPMPVLPSPFLSLSFPKIGKTFFFRPELSLDIYRTHYRWVAQLECPALPAENENRSATVWGFVLSVKGQGSYTYNRLNLRLSGGISADLRAVTLGEDLNEADMEDAWDGTPSAPAQKDLIKDYVWQDLRWLFGELGLGADFAVSEKCIAGLDVRMFLPFSRNNAAKTIPLGGYRFAVGLRVSFQNTYQ